MSNEFIEIGIPEKMTLKKNAQHLRIVRRWFGYKFIFLTLFVIVWDAFLIGWYIQAFSSLSGFQSPIGLMPFVFPLLHVAIGLGMTYFVLTGYLNKTVIDVDFNSITVRHGPLPFPGNKKIASKKIVQLYCKRDHQYNNRGLYHPFAVHAITQDRRNIKLLSGLDTSEQALFVEQEIERFLSIEDKPVKGEIR